MRGAAARGWRGSCRAAGPVSPGPAGLLAGWTLPTLLIGLAPLGLAVAAATACAPPPAPDGYRAAIEEWRRAREARLLSDDGWLTVAGLFWLKEGDNPFGAGPDNAIVLPAGSAPAHAGVFEHRGGRTVVRAAPGVTIAHDGAPVATLEMRPDSAGSPDVIALGDLRLFVIRRNERFAVRLRDRNSPRRKEFRGLRWFPVDPAYRVEATFAPHDPPRPIAVPNILGHTEPMLSPGTVSFTLRGRALRLDPVFEEAGAKELFFIFRDETSGSETYPAGRFLYAPLPEGGRVILDFNKAYTPPCAFTAYATCPLPPPQNRLAVRIEAGEKTYGGH